MITTDARRRLALLARVYGFEARPGGHADSSFTQALRMQFGMDSRSHLPRSYVAGLSLINPGCAATHIER